jgi:hypothetical protein
MKFHRKHIGREKPFKSSLGIWVCPWSESSARYESLCNKMQFLPSELRCRPGNVLEMYGGLGDRYSFGLKDTSHYLAPALAWNLPSGWTLRLSLGFGLNGNNIPFVVRWGISREISGFGEMVSQPKMRGPNPFPKKKDCWKAWDTQPYRKS